MRQRRLTSALALVGIAALLGPAAQAHETDPVAQLEDGLATTVATDASDETARDRLALVHDEDHHIETVGSSVAKGGNSAAGDGHGRQGNLAGGLSLEAHGKRLIPDGTTDVWVHDGYGYLGTFQDPCGDGTGANGSGIRIFDVGGKNVKEVGHVPSVAGSRSNDVKVAAMNAGNILVHSNESCGGGPGGFEIWEVSDPLDPTHLASVQTDDINPLLRDGLGFVDFGVHNLFLWSQGDRDYVAAVVESEFGNFQIFDITDPMEPALTGWWGAEELAPGLGGIDWSTTTDFGAILAADAFLFDGFGSSQNKFLHDMTVAPVGDAVWAWLANWDAGLVLLDVTDPTDPTLVSVAIDPTDGDGEVNSHSVWPNADGTVVVEGEEDFSPFDASFEITSGPAAGEYPAAEGAITVPIHSLPGSEMSGPTRYVGMGCEGDGAASPGAATPMPAAAGAGEIALIQRGECNFSLKVDNASAAGYAGVVVFNDAARGDALVSMGGSSTTLPGVFVGHSTGLSIAGVGGAGDLAIGAPGESVAARAIPNQWSGLRIWDYTDPTTPVLLSSFMTECAEDPLSPNCDGRGTYSSHNVQVEGDTAYVSWYTEGLLQIDISDPTMPVLEKRFTMAGNGWENRNGGIQDIWGVYVVPGEPEIYASDRNGGLYVLRDRAG